MEYLNKKKKENENEFIKNKEIWIKEGNFKNFNISDKTIDNLKENGFEYLFPIQSNTFKPIYDGMDVVGKDRTGSGKTLAFSLPIIERLRSKNIFVDKENKFPKIVVIVPTRELCVQVTKEIEKLKNYSNEFNVLSVYGGTKIDNQLYKLKQGVDIIVGTPGRFIDLQDRDALRSDCLETLILDETDQMLDKGFKDDIEKIILNIKNQTQYKIQFILFSATLPKWIYEIANRYLNDDYLTFDLIRSTENKTSKTVEHLALYCPEFEDKINSIGDILNVYGGINSKSIIFTETKKEANEVLERSNLKVNANVLHGDIHQRQREITYEGFKNGKIKCLIATNIAARGLDVPEIDLILQFSPPKDIESYIHRSGRTARAGKTGVCITYYDNSQKDILEKIEYQAKIKFKQIGFPQQKDIINSNSDKLISSINNIPESISHNYNDIAKKLINSLGIENALSKAIALISNKNTNIKQRSLLCSTEGFKSFILKINHKADRIKYFWDILRNRFSNELVDTIKTLTFLKGREGCIFDLDCNNLEEINNFINQNSDLDIEIFAPNELPEVEDNNSNNNHNSNNNRYDNSNNNRYDNRYNNRNDNNYINSNNNKERYNKNYNKDSNDTKLFINNISYKLSEDEVIEFFEQANLRFSKIHFPKDKDKENSLKGFAFGNISSDQVDDALKLNGTFVKGRKIGIQVARD